MKNTPKFEFHEIQRDTRKLFDRLEVLLRTSVQEDLRELSEGFAVQKKAFTQSRPLIISFIGGYNAGKSTLLRALTGNQDIKIAADVCTSEVAAYDWDGVSLRDTPGVQSGEVEHDQLAVEAISDSDLLVFVITSELFNESLARFFRDLAFDQKRAASMMLVVNKIDKDPGTPETKRKDIENVTDPFNMEAFSTVFVSGGEYLNSLEEDDSDIREELEALSRFSSFTTALDSFVERGSKMGRFVAPLLAIHDTAFTARALLASKDAIKKNEIKVWKYLSNQLLQSQSRLRDRLEGLVAEFHRKVVQTGQRAASALDSSTSKQELEDTINNCDEFCSQEHLALGESIETAIDQEWQRLAIILQGGKLAGELADGSTSLCYPSEQAPTSDDSFVAPRGSHPATEVAIRQAANFLSTNLPKFGKTLRDAATGPNASDNLTGRTNSVIHSSVKTVGQKLGHKFGSWGICKVTDKLYKTGKFLEAHGGKVVFVGAAGISAFAAWRAGVQGKKLREEISGRFAKHGAEKRDSARRWISNRINDIYSPLFLEVQDQMEKLNSDSTVSGPVLEPFVNIIQESKRLLDRIHSNHVDLVAENEDKDIPLLTES